MTPDEKDARIKLLEEQRQRYWRRMWRALEVLRELDEAKAAELLSAWDLEGQTAEPPSLRAVVGHYLHALDSEDEQILPDLIEELRALVWSPGAAPIPPRQTQVQSVERPRDDSPKSNKQ